MVWGPSLFRIRIPARTSHPFYRPARHIRVRAGVHGSQKGCEVSRKYYRPGMYCRAFTNGGMIFAQSFGEIPRGPPRLSSRVVATV